MQYHFVENAFPSDELLRSNIEAERIIPSLVWTRDENVLEHRSRQRNPFRLVTHSKGDDQEFEKSSKNDVPPRQQMPVHHAASLPRGTMSAESRETKRKKRVSLHTGPFGELRDPSFLARTIRPHEGALHSNTLQLASKEVVDNIFDTQMNIVWPVTPEPYDRHTRLHLLCASELLLHTYATASAVHKDVLQGTTYWSTKPEIISHACASTRLLNQLLTNLSADTAIELALLSILLIHVSPLDWHESTLHNNINLFRPYPNVVSHIDVWGKLLIKEEQLTAGVLAMKTMVGRIGSLRDLRFGGLATQVAIGDLMVASRTCGVPCFPCHWHADADTSYLDDDAFFEKFDLPPELLAMLLRLRHTDRWVEKQMALSELTYNDHCDIMRRRCCMHHEVLSIPSFNRHSGHQAASSSGDIYEACRLTAVLYSTFVLLGMPVNTGWHLRPLRQLWRLLEKSSMMIVTTKLGPELLIWISTIAGVAAFSTEHKSFYQSLLQRTLTQLHIWDWETYRGILRDFCWSDSACSAGTDILWDSLQT